MFLISNQILKEFGLKSRTTTAHHDSIHHSFYVAVLPAVSMQAQDNTKQPAPVAPQPTTVASPPPSSTTVAPTPTATPTTPTSPVTTKPPLPQG